MPSNPSVTTAADAERTAIAAQTLAELVALDPRAEAGYRIWLAAHGLPALIRRVRKHPTVSNARAVHDAILADDPGDSTLLWNLLADLGLTRYDWLAGPLRATWQTRALNEATGRPMALRISTRARPVTVTLEPGESPPALARRVRAITAAQWPARGRRAIKKHASLARNVAWFYRAVVKRPPDTIVSLAGEYARAHGRTNDSRSVVQNGLARAKDLLAFIVSPPLPK